ncbi:MAG: hypothetical protein M1419_05750, partial [Bacteroidetes bacterium]|nr:hypothetical protein [Bacteroidota bacterium]
PRANAVKYVAENNGVNLLTCICAIDKATLPPLLFILISLSPSLQATDQYGSPSNKVSHQDNYDIRRRISPCFHGISYMFSLSSFQLSHH